MKALDAVDRLSGRLDAQKADLATALDHLPAGLKVLADQRAQLTAMLSCARPARCGRHAGHHGQPGRHGGQPQGARPTLTQLTKAGDDLPNSLRLLLSFPFPDNAATGAIKGDYANLHATLDLNVAELLKQDAAGLKASGASGLPSLPARRAADPADSAEPARPVHPARTVRLRRRGDSGPPACPTPPRLLKSLQHRAVPARVPAPRRVVPPRRGASRTARLQAQLLSLLLGGLGSMIRRSVKVQLVAFAVITLLAVSFLSARYVGLGRLLLRRRLRRHRRLRRQRRHLQRRRGDLPRRPGGPGRPAAPDPERRAGRPPAGQAAPTCRPTPWPSWPTGRSVGEQYVDLQPQRSSAPYLAAGGRIPRRGHPIPVPVANVLQDVDTTVNSVDRQQLVTVVERARHRVRRQRPRTCSGCSTRATP